jgi:hypothetical protein
MRFFASVPERRREGSMHRFKRHGIGALVVLGAAVMAAVFVTGALGGEGQDQPIEFTHNVRDRAISTFA